MRRRSFLKGAAAAGIGLAAARRLDAQAKDANDRINIAVIGVGGMGRGHFNEYWNRSKDPANKLALVGACDVWDIRAQDAAAMTKGAARWHRYYTEVLGRKDVDAVVIATPEHWHAKISIDAMKAGKDVYCEKPMTRYWEQAKEVAKVAAETKAVFQVGAQGSSDLRWHKAGEIVKQGGIGPIVWTHTGAFRNSPEGDWNWPLQFRGKVPRPGVDLDWEFYCGHKWSLAPKMPFDKQKYFRFRKYWAFSGGLATDLLYHSLAHHIYGIVPQFPTRVVALGGFPAPEHNYKNDFRETPTLFDSLVEWEPGFTTRLLGTQENRASYPEGIQGQYGDLTVGGPGVIIRAEDPWRDKMMELTKTLPCFEGAEIKTFKKDGKDKLEEIRVASEGPQDHRSVWLGCIRTRKRTNLPADVAFKVMVPIALSVKSWRENRMIHFDPKTEQVVDRKQPRQQGI